MREGRDWIGLDEKLTNQNVEKDYDSDEVVEDEESGPDQLIQTVLLEHPPRVAFTRVAEHGPEQLVHRPTHSEAKPRRTCTLLQIHSIFSAKESRKMQQVDFVPSEMENLGYQNMNPHSIVMKASLSII